MQRLKEHRFNVGDGQTHYNQGLHQPELAKSSSKESLFDFNESPTNLGVTVSNGYVAKSLPESSEEGDEGSLPCTLEQHSDSETGASVICASNQVLDNDTITTRNGIELRHFRSLSFLREFSGLSKCRWNQNKAPSTMKKRWCKNFFQGTNSMDPQKKNANLVKAEEAKAKAKYPGRSNFLMKRLTKWLKYCDSGGYSMAKAKVKNKQHPGAGTKERTWYLSTNKGQGSHLGDQQTSC